MRYSVFLCLLLLSWNHLWAQSPQALAIHFDKPFYVTGEMIWYDLYLPPAFSGKAVTLKAMLTTPSGERVGEYFLATEGATSLESGFKLPYQLEPAMYRLLILGTGPSGYSWLKLAEVFVPVYNDLAQDKQPLVATTDQFTPGPEIRDLQISIVPKPGPYRKRAEVEAVIEVRDAAGRPVEADLSVSVIDADLMGPGAGMRSNFRMTRTVNDFQPEDLADGLFINGRITDETGLPRGSITLGAYQADADRTYVFETTADGNFTIPLPDFSGNSTVQFVDLYNDSIRVMPDVGLRLSPAPPLPYNEAVSNYLKWSQNRKVIYQLYNTVEVPLEREFASFKPLAGDPDQRIVLKEYTAFKNLYNFFLEVSTPLKLRRDPNGSYYAQMFNPDQRMRAFYQGAPIFIVDGKITRDANFIQSLDLARIDTIDLYFDFFNLTTRFGKLGNSGVAVLQTSITDLKMPQADLATIFPIAGYRTSMQPVAHDRDDPQQPEFRPQIFWDPTIRTDAAGRAMIRFAQTDDLGTFLINVVAHSADGRLGYGAQTYEVQW